MLDKISAVRVVRVRPFDFSYREGDGFVENCPPLGSPHPFEISAGTFFLIFPMRRLHSAEATHLVNYNQSGVSHYLLIRP